MWATACAVNPLCGDVESDPLYFDVHFQQYGRGDSQARVCVNFTFPGRQYVSGVPCE